MPTPSSRRRFLARSGVLLGAGATGPLARGLAPRRPLLPEEGQTDHAFLQSVADRGGGLIARRAAPYAVDHTVTLPAGCRLLFEDGAEILFDPPVRRRPRALTPVFLVDGDDVAVGAASGALRVRARRPDADLFAVLLRGRRNVRILNILAIECGHLFCSGASEAYGAVITRGANANVSRAITVIGGGALFERRLADPWHGACTIQFTDGFTVAGARYRNVSHGVQWWGGDANPAADGAIANERKCRNGRITGVRVDGASGASVWGAMGEAIRVVDCAGVDAGDVGFDAEGSRDVEFLRCRQQGATNGCFAVFFLNDAIVFRDCEGRQSRSDAPLFRSHGSGSSLDGGSVSIEGGRFLCTADQPSSVDDAYGDIPVLLIRNAHLENVILRLVYRRHRRVMIEGNEVVFPKRVAARFDAVVVNEPAPHDAGAGGGVSIRRNRVRSGVAQPSGSYAVRVIPSSAPGRRAPPDLSANDISGFPLASTIG